MREFVFNAESYDVLLADATSLGFTHTDDAGVEHIIVNGPMKSGGSYFLNYVGTVYEPIVGDYDLENPPAPVARPGVWGRLRANGDVSDLPGFSTSITQYTYLPGDEETPGGWVNVATGEAAPDWVGDIGVIA